MPFPSGIEANFVAAADRKLHGGSGLDECGTAQGKIHVEDGAVREIAGMSDDSTVREDDLAADRQSEAGAVRLGRFEEREDVQALRNSGSGVADRNANV